MSSEKYTPSEEQIVGFASSTEWGFSTPEIAIQEEQ